ncbi:MAG: peptide deformylase [Pleomorphochaeta sp.]
MLEIYTIGEEILRNKAKKIEKFDSALELLVNAMFEKMDEADGVGLAGPQVGVDLRIFVIDDHKGVRKAFINPEIIETSMEECSMEEGCLSIPGVYAYLSRSERVTVQAQDEKGKTFRLEADNLLARAIQHENDHLNGILFADRLNDKDRTKLFRTYERRNKLKRGSVK